MRKAIGIGIIVAFLVPFMLHELVGAGLWWLFAGVGLAMTALAGVGIFVAGVALATSSDPRPMLPRILALIHALTMDRTTAIRKR